jgi:BirA family transcriptional regulator, biotin operon repressor / biotin---[acetyl-CoA-carboxylase] ligase
MIISYDQIDSTNRVAKELAAEGRPSGTVVIAASQSAGKGQYGRNFNSPVGGLYFSLLLEPDIPTETLSLITLATGLACRNVLHQAFGLQPHIKWPNDIYLDGKKVAGILCENLLFTHLASEKAKVIIGVGLNVNNRIQDFAVEIQSIITTVFEHLLEPVELEPLLEHVVHAITANVTRLKFDRQHLLAEWQLYDFLLDKPVVYASEALAINGIGRGISAQGLYRVLDDTGVEHEVIGGQIRPQS